MILELGKNTPEDKNCSDYKKYIESMALLKRRLVKIKSRKPYFVVQSRKGPKVLEMFFSKQERLDMKILSEHALPFLFSSLAREGINKCDIVIVDDAIYYGTTVENLASEIKEYEKSYGIKVDLEIYTAIKAIWSKEIIEAKVFTTKENIREGYEHYFVNLLMSDIRSIPTSMEVEFPVVTYRTGKHISKSDLQTQLRKFYQKRGRLYDVEQYNSNTFKEIGVERFSILLNNDTGASFSKMRFYIDKDAIRVAFISPHLMPNNISAIEHIFDKGTEDVKNTWNSIVRIVNESKPISGGAMYRNRQRTLIVAANYLLSLYLYFKENQTIQSVISFLSDKNEIKTDFDEQQLRLRYIFYDDEKLVSNILFIMEEYQNSPSAFTPNLFSHNQRPSKNQIFEATGYPSDSEKEILQDFNARMLGNSKNINEKLCALFFNQTTLIEKWSRQFGDNTGYRLKFGFNYRGLLCAVDPNDKDDSHVSFNHNLCEIHRWIDRRIDQGCVVPQYIVDNEKGQWDRVFRPGENEEAILSTLTRFVAFVIDRMKKIFSVHYIPKLILKKLLCVIVAKNFNPSLQDVLRIKMIISETGLNYICEDEYSGEIKTNDIVDYLDNMLILESSGNFIDISKRFIGTEQVMNTNFSTKTKEEIESAINEFQKELNSNNFDFLSCYSLCNYHLRDFFTSQQEEEAIAKCNENLITAIELLKRKNTIDANNYISNAFSLAKLYIMPKSFFEEPFYSTNLYKKYIDINQMRFSRIIFVVNILLLLFYSFDNDGLKAYVDTINDDYSDYLGSAEFIESIKTAIDKEKHVTQIASDQGRMRLLQNLLTKQIESNE